MKLSIRLIAAMLATMMLITAPAYAVIMTPPKAATQTTSCKALALAGKFSPFCSSYITTNAGKSAGWRVATGKIDLGKPTSRADTRYGNENVLPGLSGLVSSGKSALTLKEKADIKLNPVKKEGKYQSLVSFVKEQDASKVRVK